MNIGLLDTFAPARLAFWEAFITQLGLGVVKPQLSLEESHALGRESLPDEASYVQLAVGRLLELERESDFLAVPALEPESEREVRAPWLSDFPSVYARRLSLNAPASLPVYGDEAALERAALRLGQEWTRSIGVVRKALDRTLPLTRTRHKDPALERAGAQTVAVLGLSLLLETPFLLGELPAQLAQLGLFPVYSSALERSKTLEYASRVSVPLVLESERQVAGAMAMLEGKGAVRGLLFAVAQGDALGQRLAERLSRGARKPALVLTVAPDALDGETLAAFAARLGAAKGG